MKIALIHPASPNPAKNAAIWPPLGLCRIASYLVKHGHEVNVIEDALHRLPISEYSASMVAGGYDVIGIGAMTIQFGRAVKWANTLRSCGFCGYLVGGGPGFAALSDADALNTPLSHIVRGDGERALLDIAEGRIAPGIVNGQYVDYEPISFDHLADYMQYGDHLIDGTRAVSLLTSRGCPYSCKFCGSPALFGRRVHYYPVAEVVENMRKLSGQYGINAFRLMDDTFTLHQGRLKEFCDAVRPHGWKLSCLTHSRAVREESLGWMKDAGFEFVAMGVESGNNGILEAVGKRQTVDDVERSARLIDNAGIKLEALFMVGLPGETLKTIRESIKLARWLNPYRVHAQFFTPFPGSQLHDEIRAGQHGHIIEEDVAKYNHRVPTFIPKTISYDDLMAGASEFFEFCGRKVGA